MSSEISLDFQDIPFTLEKMQVLTSEGEKQVEYRHYRHFPYLAKPVHLVYQSLDIHVPVRADGMKVDASNAPVLIMIGVGGYMACPNDEKLFTGSGGPGGPRGPGDPHIPMGPTPDHPFGDTYEKAGTDSGPKALARGWVVVIPSVRQ